MKHVLVLGAGKSASVLIEYLLDEAGKRDWHVRVADLNVEVARLRIGNSPNDSPRSNAPTRRRPIPPDRPVGRPDPTNPAPLN